jgi:hypothetical protein
LTLPASIFEKEIEVFRFLFFFFSEGIACWGGGEREVERGGEKRRGKEKGRKRGRERRRRGEETG